MQISDEDEYASTYRILHSETCGHIRILHMLFFSFILLEEASFAVMLARKELIFLLILYYLRHGSVLIFPCSCLLEVSYIRLKYNVLFVCIFVSQLQLQRIVCKHILHCILLL